MISTDEILNYITDEVVMEIMKDNNTPIHHTSTDKKTGQKLLWFRTICHDGDSHKLCYFSETHDFYCYTNCGRMTFFNFICRIRGIPKERFYESIYYISNFIDINIKSLNRRGLGDNQIGREIKEELQILEKSFQKRQNDSTIYTHVNSDYQEYLDIDYLSRVGEEGYLLQLNKGQKDIKNFYDQTILNYFDGDTFYEGWINEGISIPTMKKFNIRWYEYKKHIIIPHYDIDGNLVGIRRRSLLEEDSKRKYMPEIIQGVEYEHSLGLNLYGLHQNKEAIQKSRIAVIVEAEKSVLLSDTYYGDKSTTVATCGFSISDWQVKSLLKLGVNTIYLGFDKDYDLINEWQYKNNEEEWRKFKRYKEKIYSMAGNLTDFFNVRIIKDRNGLLQIKDSPFDRGKQVYEKLKKESEKFSKNDEGKCYLQHF